MNADPQNPREQLERLQEALSTRQSTQLFAHAGLSLVVALILGGATAKLFWDSLRTPYLAWAGLVASLALAAYGLSRLSKGRTVLADELTRYATLLELRQRLGLDQPAALPR